MISVLHFRKYVVDLTLEHTGLYSEAASNLLIGTAVQESRLKYMKQISGPALGFFQIEPFTLNDVYDNYLEYSSRDKLFDAVESLKIPILSRTGNLISNPCYGAAIARVIYYRDKYSLPKHDDIVGLAEYWKRVYNTEKGKGTVQEFVDNYHKYVIGDE